VTRHPRRVADARPSIPRRRLRIAAVLIPAALLVIAVLPPDATLRLVVARLIGVTATLLFALRLRELPPTVWGIWICFWGYHAGTVVADVIYDWMTVQQGEPPFPGPADAVYLLTYAFAFVGLRRMTRRLSPERNPETWIDAAIITLALASVVFSFVIGPLLFAVDRFDLTALVSVAYPLLDLVILATLARAIIVPRVTNRALELVGLSMLLTFGYDIVYNYLAVIGDWTQYRLLEVVWTGALLLLALAPYARGAAEFRPTPAASSDRVTPLRAVALSGAVLIGPALLVYAVWTEDLRVAKWLAPAGLLVVGLLIWRMFRLLRTVQEQSSQLAGLARTDPLTGLPNRRTWDHELHRTARLADDANQSLVIALLDLDHFKWFNDTHGHQAGDAFLVDCVRHWRTVLDPSLTLARYGGEEFGILLPGYDVASAGSILERLRLSMPPGASVSIGATARRANEDPHIAVGRADGALYRAKSAGRDQVVFDEDGTG